MDTPSQLTRCSECGYVGPQHFRSIFAWWQILLIYVPLGGIVFRVLVPNRAPTCPACSSRRALGPAESTATATPSAMDAWRYAEANEEKRIKRHETVAYIGIALIVVVAVVLSILFPDGLFTRR